MSAELKSKAIHVNALIPSLAPDCAWKQPPASEIEVDEQFAVMTNWAFLQLADSIVLPTPKRPGMMFKKKFRGVWWLGWYGQLLEKNYIEIHWREISVI